MSYKIVIPAIAIVSVCLFVSGFSLDAYANHLSGNQLAGHIPHLPSWKSAYMFDCSGNGGGHNWGGNWDQVRSFIQNNNGYYHACGYNWINQAFHEGLRTSHFDNDDGRILAAPCSHANCWDDHPVTHQHIGRPPAWGLHIQQYDNVISDLKNRGLGDSENSKLILRGVSFGGGAVTMMATERPQHKVDLVYLLDPVGPNGFRETLVKACGITEGNVDPANCPSASRIFHTHVTQVINLYQNEGLPPTDHSSGFTFDDPHSNVKQIKFLGCITKNQKDRCHNEIVENRGNNWNSGWSVGMDDASLVFPQSPGYSLHEQLQSMNNPPFFVSGVPNSVITIDEGDITKLNFLTKDTKSEKYEKLENMDLNIKFFNNIAESQLSWSDPGTKSQSDDKLFLERELEVLVDDGFGQNGTVQVQVEDNGFPCGDCTAAGNIAMGSLGHWARENLEFEILNVPPTVNPQVIMADRLAILIIDTTDPSNADTTTGFNYTINWGDGNTEEFSYLKDRPQIFEHIYENSGSYSIQATATDKDGDKSNDGLATAYTPFVKLLDDFDDLGNDGTLKQGQGNSFTSKVEAILKHVVKGHTIPACNVANALINEVNAFVISGKFTEQQGEQLMDEMERSMNQISCNGGTIVVEKYATPTWVPFQWTFTGDVAGTIGHDEQIKSNVLSGQYTSTEPLPWPDGWELFDIICSDVDSGQTSFDTATFNVDEDEYVLCIFFNADYDLPPTPPSLTITGRGNGDTSSDRAISDIRLHSSNPSSPQTSDDLTDDKKGSGGDEHLTRPTFGLSHDTFETIVDSGFRFNEQSFTINDNHHTPFAQQTVNIGEVNIFEAKIYADKRLKVQEFLFGIPNVGEAHLAELGVEVWYDYNGNIEEVKAIQKSNVIDKETLVATHEKTKCQATDSDERCDVTNVSMVFLEPLKDKVMAVKAIDYKQRFQITYLNEGVDIAGDSLNPMQTYLIPSNVRDSGLITVKQLEKYSPYWESDDGRMFEKNSFGSFKEVNQEFERFHDDGTAYTRLHSEFGKVMEYELKRATGIFDASELVSDLPESFETILLVPKERITDEMKAKMLEQEEIAKKILEESKVQARW